MFNCCLLPCPFLLPAQFHLPPLPASHHDGQGLHELPPVPLRNLEHCQPGQLHARHRLSEEWEAEDDVKGGPLDPREVKIAREKEIKYLWDMEVDECSTEAEARARTGRNPVGLKWIDTNQGSAEAPRYRSRLVCTEVRHKGVEPIFSATPPLETLRILLGVACQEDVFQVEDPMLITIEDVSRAHFYADAVRDVVRLPSEDPKTKQPGVCGKLRKTMDGSLDAAQRWGEHYAQVVNRIPPDTAIHEQMATKKYITTTTSLRPWWTITTVT